MLGPLRAVRTVLLGAAAGQIYFPDFGVYQRTALSFWNVWLSLLGKRLYGNIPRTPKATCLRLKVVTAFDYKIGDGCCPDSIRKHHQGSVERILETSLEEAQ
jgi:hypothetical protein